MVKPGKSEIFVVLFLGVCERASAFLSELREVHEIGNYSERMKCNVKILYWSTSFVKKPDEARKCG